MMSANCDFLHLDQDIHMCHSGKKIVSFVNDFQSSNTFMLLKLFCDFFEMLTFPQHFTSVVSVDKSRQMSSFHAYLYSR